MFYIYAELSSGSGVRFEQEQVSFDTAKHKTEIAEINNSYLSLPDKFYNIVKPSYFTHAEVFLSNKKLCDELNVSTKNPGDFIALFFGDDSNKETKSFAQAYAGHQFGHFTKLGDGRVPPPDDKTLVKSFLKDNRFLILSPNMYNMLGIGTTQLYNDRVVYNHKRHGLFELGGLKFRFHRKQDFPTVLTKEFLLIDLVSNLKTLAEELIRVICG